MHDQPQLFPFDGIDPSFRSEPKLGPGSSIGGKATIGHRAEFSAGVVIRADGHFIRVGDDAFIGADSTLHISGGYYPTIVGDRVTVGSNACVHACTVGDDCVIGDEVVILDGSVVGDGVVIESGSNVFPRSTLEAGWLYAGSPAKPVRPIEAAARQAFAQRLRDAPASPRIVGEPGIAIPDDVFVAQTASLRGKISLATDSSVFFGCRLDAGSGSITVGADTNIQDNSILLAGDGDIVIGAGSTVGHNVLIEACTIGDRSLIGIRAHVAAGTRIGDDVLLAAGATTEPCQVLEAGWLWGGSPARPLKPLDDAKRKVISATIDHYVEYARLYRAQGS